MEGGEISNFFKVCLIVFASLCYCYTISKNVPKGIIRLLTILPVVSFFFVLPLNLTSIHLVGITAFFITWLSNFKLLLFAFGKGPLSSDPSISLPRFIAVGCLPIKIQQHPSQKIDPKPQNNAYPSQIDQIKEHPSQKIDPKLQDNAYPSQIDQIKEHPSQKIDPKLQDNAYPSQIDQIKEHPSPKTTKKASKSPLNHTIKILLAPIVFWASQHRQYVHPTVIFICNCYAIYILLESILVSIAFMARVLWGLEFEPQFDEPYLSSSLQDFWSRRWCIVVSSTLRPTVYDPTLHLCTKFVGRKWAQLLAVLSTFVVSGLMHELIFYYLGREKPTWEVTCFFLLHGVCLMVEVVVKKEINGKWMLPWVISGFLTVGFVMVTSFSLFVPQLQRCKFVERGFDEYKALGALIMNIGST